jgi:hypothetical protein
MYHTLRNTKVNLCIYREREKEREGESSICVRKNVFVSHL